MPLFKWNDKKNECLRQDRGITFEEVVDHIAQGDLLDTIEHHNPTRYPGQRIFVVSMKGYVYLIPFVEDDETILSQDDHSQSKDEETVRNRSSTGGSATCSASTRRKIEMKLTEDEQRLLDSVERGEWQSIPDVEREAERYREAARDTTISHMIMPLDSRKKSRRETQDSPETKRSAR